MSGDTCDVTCACPYTCKIPNTSEKSSLTPLSIVKSCMSNRNLVLTSATLVTVILCCHNSARSSFIINETFGMLQQQETLYFGYTTLGSHLESQIIKSNRLCRQARTCKLTLLRQFLPRMDSNITFSYPIEFSHVR